MIPPFIARLATQPELLAEHGGAYARLAALEAAELGRLWRWRALLWAVVGVGLAIGLLLGGVALMLAGALPIAAMPQPAWLLAVPAVPLLLALAAALALRGLASPAPAFRHLREQLQADAQLLREAAR